jgi:hypothetical protein
VKVGKARIVFVDSLNAFLRGRAEAQRETAGKRKYQFRLVASKKRLVANGAKMGYFSPKPKIEWFDFR